MFGNRQGTPITEQQAKQAQTYIDLVGWQPTRWTTNNDTTYPQLIPNGYDTFEANIQGQQITEEQAKQRQTYVNAGWDFTNVWTIDEGESFPYFRPSSLIFDLIVHVETTSSISVTASKYSLKYQNASAHITAESTVDAHLEALKYIKADITSRATVDVHPTVRGFIYTELNIPVTSTVTAKLQRLVNVKADITAQSHINVVPRRFGIGYELIESHIHVQSTVRIFAKSFKPGEEETVDFIIIRDKNTLETITETDNVIDPLIYEEINGRYDFKFSTVPSEMQYINTNHLVEIENDYFDIVRIAKNRSLSGVKIDVTCDHISYRLNKPEVELKFENKTPEYIVEKILRGTDFKIGTIEFSEPINFTPGKQSRRSMLIALAKYLGGELLWNKFELSILERRGHDKGLNLKVGENIREITAEIDATATPTRYAYEVNVLDLAHLPQYQFLSTCELGDTVGVEDTELGINTSLRVVSREYNPFQKVTPKVQIGNVIRDLTDYLIQDEEEEKEQFDLNVFKIGDIDCLKLEGIDVTEQERERLRNGTAYEPTATIEYEELEQYLGLFVERASFDYGIRVREIVCDQVTDIYYNDIPSLRNKYYPTDDGMIIQVILGHDIDNLTAESEFRAFAVKFVEKEPEPVEIKQIMYAYIDNDYGRIGGLKSVMLRLLPDITNFREQFINGELPSFYDTEEPVGPYPVAYSVRYEIGNLVQVVDGVVTSILSNNDKS